MESVPKRNGRVNKQTRNSGKAVLALPPIPEDMLGQEPVVLDSFSLVPDLARRIENAGHGYARL